MKFRSSIDGIKMTEFNNFRVKDILECGQCFRFEKIEDDHYELIAFGKSLHVRQTDCVVDFFYEDKVISMAEFDVLWAPYFDLQRDYGSIAAKISVDDLTMQQAVAFAPGIRLLQQDPWEMLISFIISANNRIPQIKRVIKNICQRYGADIGGQNYSFPAAEELAKATVGELRELKTGFRDKYILAAAQKVAADELDVNRDTPMPTEDLRRALLSVHGVGEKVAHCILLFGYGRYDSFPVDTWVRRVMQQYYFDGKAASASQIHKFAQEKYGELSGFAQQYLFHYIRSKK